MNGIERIAKERQRQIDKEGFSAAHDDGHKAGEIATAAACYAAGGHIYKLWTAGEEHGFNFVEMWPWSEDWDGRRKFDRVRQLEIAGALCAAEIDRLIRKTES